MYTHKGIYIYIDRYIYIYISLYAYAYIRSPPVRALIHRAMRFLPLCTSSSSDKRRGWRIKHDTRRSYFWFNPKLIYYLLQFPDGKDGGPTTTRAGDVL